VKVLNNLFVYNKSAIQDYMTQPKIQTVHYDVLDKDTVSFTAKPPTIDIVGS
jgi:hypothetical protein